MVARIRANRWLQGSVLAFLAATAHAQDPSLSAQAPAAISSHFGSELLDDKPVGLMAETTPVFETVDENTYIVGPGDILYVAMGPRGYKVLVSPDGAVIIDGFPPINVAGKSLAETRRILTQSYQRYYKAGNIQIALAQSKKFQVSVTGAVNAPGMYVVTAGARLSNVIRGAGGVSRASSQQVRIRNAAGKEVVFDLGAYYRDGDLDNNPYVSQGDHIFMGSIDYAQPVVQVRSERGTRTVALASGDDLESVVARAADFENTLDWDHVNVFKDGKLVQRIERTAARGYAPPAGATLEVRTAQLIVFVGGAVNVPGPYPYNPTFTILDYVARSGITYNTADAKKVTVIDAKGDTRRVNAKKDSPRPGDHILVPRSGEAKTRDWVGLTASVSALIFSIISLNVLINQ